MTGFATQKRGDEWGTVVRLSTRAVVDLCDIALRTRGLKIRYIDSTCCDGGIFCHIGGLLVDAFSSFTD